MTADQPADQSVDPDAPPELEDEFHRVREGFDTIPSLEQFEILEALAARLEVVVKPAQRDGVCIDIVTGSHIDVSMARELLELADPHRWELNVAQAHQAEVVAAIGDHADWRALDTVQRRALSAWHLHYPELTYGTIMHLGPQMARERLQLHRDLQNRSEPGLTLRLKASQLPEPTALEQVTDLEPPVPPVDTAPTAATKPASVISDVPAGLYCAVDRIDEATRQMLAANGLQPPDDAKGYMAVDPYGLVNSLNEVVMGYLDKLEVPIPTGGVSALVENVARYNDIDRHIELSVGQVIWFPERSVLQSWLSDNKPR